MKRLLFILALLLMQLNIFAQKSLVDKVMNDYSGKKGYTTVLIKKMMFELFMEISDEKEDQEVRDVIENLNNILIFTVDLNEINDPQFKNDCLGHLRKLLPPEKYEEMMVIQEENQEVKFLVRKEGKQIRELVMLVCDQKEPAIICLDGIIDLKKIGKLSGSMNISGLEHLNGIDHNTN